MNWTREQYEDYVRNQNNLSNRRMVSQKPKPDALHALVKSERDETRALGAAVIRHRVTFTFYRCGQELDDDNATFCAKSLRDCLTACALIQGDSKSEAEFIYVSIRVPHRKEEKTVIEIEEIL